MQQEFLCVERDAHRAKDFGIFVPVTPIPRRDKSATPKAGAGRPRGLLVGIVIV
jgi:hypothetical protein